MGHHLPMMIRNRAARVGRQTKKHGVVLGVAAMAAVLSVGGSATAAKLITSADIKDNTIKLADINDSAERQLRGRAGTQGPQGLQGASGVDGQDGAQGPAGPAGPQGPAGANGVSSGRVPYEARAISFDVITGVQVPAEPELAGESRALPAGEYLFLDSTFDKGCADNSGIFIALSDPNGAYEDGISLGDRNSTAPEVDSPVLAAGDFYLRAYYYCTNAADSQTVTVNYLYRPVVLP